MRIAVPELEEALDGSLDFDFYRTTDLQTYLKLLEALSDWNSLNAHVSLTEELAESLEPSKASEWIHLWEAFVPAP